MKEILTQVLPIVEQFVVSILAILIPIFIGYVFKKFKGSKNFSYAMEVAEGAVKYIIGFFNSNPNAEKSVESIMAQFKERMIALIPNLTNEQLDYLFGIIRSSLLKALGITDATTFAKVSFSNINSDKVSIQKGLFGIKVKTKPLF